MMKVLLVGGGGREHALAWKLARSPGLTRMYFAPGNAGLDDLGDCVPVQAEDIAGVVGFARQEKIDLVIVGPEDPLCAGMVDALQAAGIRAFGPSQAAARLEGDKAFAKEMMRQRSVPTGEARIFTTFRDAKVYVASREGGVVVKAAGLAKGKGVAVCDDPADAILALENIMVNRIYGAAGDKVVVEEKLVGPEVSILALVDGNTIYVMDSAQDHKPIGEGDTGPNTGGMGAYSPTRLVNDRSMRQIESEILVPIMDALRSEGVSYKGVLYAGLMLTAAGPKVLEFNCRFGDPEIQPLLMRLKTDLLEVCMAVVEGKLDSVSLEWDPRPAICVVMSSGGYPGDYQPGKPITGLAEAGAMEDVVVFHAGTQSRGHQVVTAGGRVLGVTALGDTLEDAARRCYAAVDKIHFEGAYCRRDIGAKAMKP
ncbi:MAG: phosphoribosylamine--glycine ligase [Phycisphaerales bacterium]|nr:phosphoribosylamine--glycine ligase [Phycisphaerales bacterium]